MSISLSTTHTAERAASALTATLTRLNSGTTGATVSIYGNVRPANGAVAGAAPLAVITLALPAGTITNGVLNLAVPPDTLIDTTGTAVWARVIANGVTVFDCGVSDVAGADTIRLASTQLYAGGLVRMSSGTLS